MLIRLFYSIGKIISYRIKNTIMRTRARRRCAPRRTLFQTPKRGKTVYFKVSLLLRTRVLYKKSTSLFVKSTNFVR